MSGVGCSLVNVLIDGQSFANCIEAEIASSGGFCASTFRVGFALGTAPQAAALWAALNVSSSSSINLQLEVQFGRLEAVSGAVSWTSQILGSVDHISFDAGLGIVELEGRDFMSRLIRPPTTQNFVNQTSSEIVASLGAAAGLAVDADPTTTIVGQYYQLEHSRNSLDSFTRFATSLDIVTYLAQLEGYNCFVSGQTLFFLSRDTTPAQSSSIDVANLASAGSPPVTRLRFDRRTAFDAGAQITLKSWNSRQRTAVQAQYPASFDGNSSFVFVSPNLLHDAAAQRAQTLHQDIVRHALVVSGEIADWSGLDIRGGLQITNSPGWDGSYVIDNVTKHVSARSGSVQTFVAYSQ